MGLLLILIGSALYVFLLQIPYEDLSPWLTAARLISALTLTIIYFGGAVRSAIKPLSQVESRDLWIVGIALTWITSTAFAASNEIGRILGRPVNTVTSEIVGFFGALIVIAAGFHWAAAYWIRVPGISSPKVAVVSVAIASALYLVFRITTGVLFP